MKKIIIIGGGAAGMMAAYSAARAGGAAVILEKNEKLGKKLYITGKGRCNFTNSADINDFMDSIPRNPYFLYSAFAAFSNNDMMTLMKDAGCEVKVERGGRAFPESDKASDITKALSKLLRECGVEVRLDTAVDDIIFEDGRVKGVREKNGGTISSSAVIIATGGLSYKTTGSTGDGFIFSKKAGHEVTDLSPSLVPLDCQEDYIRAMQGLSLKNVRLSLFLEGRKKPIFSDFGEMAFTHFGISGPLVLSASSMIKDEDFKKGLFAEIDLKSALSKEQLKERIIRYQEENPKKRIRALYEELLPRSMADVFPFLSKIPEERVLAELKKSERDMIIELLKAFPFSISGKRDYNEAVITRGGVSVDEIDPGTMESKLMKGLFFAGEVIDCDALTGGFNLQIAWSTGFLAGKSAAAISYD